MSVVVLMCIVPWQEFFFGPFNFWFCETVTARSDKFDHFKGPYFVENWLIKNENWPIHFHVLVFSKLCENLELLVFNIWKHLADFVSSKLEFWVVRLQFFFFNFWRREYSYFIGKNKWKIYDLYRYIKQ